GLLPHYVDVDQPFCAQFLDKVDGAVLIHPLQPPLEVLAQIDACDIVFSSSLHGLICADSVGTPNAWVELSRNVVGDGYKFADYYSCFDLTPTALRPMDPRELEHAVEDITSTYSRPQLDRLCADLIDAFPSNL
ncbi:MAG: pyruvyl transferase, partial [Verrucomicrobiales bacterium]